MDEPVIVGFSEVLTQVEATPRHSDRGSTYIRHPFPDPEHPEQFDPGSVAQASLVVIDFRDNLNQATLVYDLLVLGNPGPVPPCLLIASPATVHWVERCVCRPRDWVLHAPPGQPFLKVSLPGPAGHDRRRQQRVVWPGIDLYLGEFCDDGPAVEQARGIDASPSAILIDAHIRYHVGQGVCIRLRSESFWAAGSGIIARSSRAPDGWNRYLVANLRMHDGDRDWFSHLSD